MMRGDKRETYYEYPVVKLGAEACMLRTEEDDTECLSMAF